MNLAAAPRTYTISEITNLIQQKLEQEVGSVWVSGEISNLRKQASGITYFTLKDAHAQLNAILFSNIAATLDFEPSDGRAVRAFGLLSVYPPQGRYQLVIHKLEPEGLGQLMVRFEELKQKLDAEGLFAAARKKQLPLLPRHIGIVTSPTGAALRDILRVLERRFPNLDILIRGARVQGDSAAAEIALGIERLNAIGDTILPQLPRREVIIVTRGGGSLEDLWPFNEEIVARAIAASHIPVISAVGHEIDTTISDLVADLRSPTPSAAAEQLIGRKSDFEATIDNLQHHLFRSLQHRRDHLTARLAAARTNRVFSEPGHAVARFRQDIDHLELRLQNALHHRLQNDHRRCHEVRASLAQQRADHLPGLQLRLERNLNRLQHSIQRHLEQQHQQITLASRQLDSLNPLAVLARGYSITRLAGSTRIVRHASEAPHGTSLETLLHDGSLTSKVE